MILRALVSNRSSSRFLTAKTYEMHMFHSASLKLGLERAVLSQNREQNEESDETGKTTRKSDREAQAKEIDELLKKGAYDVFRDDDDTEAEKFMESDIDQLLEHSSKTISYGATTTSSLGSGLGSFSKASFVADTDEGAKDVDLDDPDFWSKAIGFEVPSEETPDDIAAMLDDGVKRNRKQVQQYDPYAETALADQLKKDRVALEKILEKEERARLIEEKKWKKKKTKEEKSKIAHDGDPFSSNTSTVEEKGPPLPKSYLSSGHSANTTVKLPKLSKEVKHRKSKRGDRVRALFRAENEAPLIERFKQAWEIPQRNRATAATIRFGFGRFCKLRNESNLTSLPLQDLEVFVRSYLYQLSLQVAVLIMSQIRRNSTTNIHLLIQQWTSLHSPREIEWIADSIQSVLNFQSDVESDRRCLRMPLVLAEPTYVDDLRHGSGFRALRRIGILARLNGLIENCVDSIFATLGQEELGKRGCAVHELTNLDVDLKARFVTTEELTLIIGSSFQNLDLKSPVSWWDRSCDVALIIGTFIHGYGNYEGMRRDQSLPFGDKILQLCALDTSYKAAMQRFRIAADATVATYEDALEAGRLKAEAEVQAAVAAAAKAAQQREFDAALLRKGGSEAADAVRNMPETQVNDAFEFDGTDSHFVTLPRMHANIQGTIRSSTTNSPLDLSLPVDAVAVGLKAELGSEPRTTKVTTGRINEHHYLPMPDSRVLDYRLARLLSEIEGEEMNSEVDGDLWLKTADVLQSLSVRRAILPLFEKDAYDIINEYSGVGFGGNQCGISHRTLNDGSDFSFGSANHQISLLAYGTDAPRYLRALGVPMNITRFAVSGLVYAEKSCVDALMTSERLRFFGREVNDEVNTSRYQSVESGPEVDTLPNIGDSISAEERDDQTDGIPTMTLDIETSDFKMRTSSRPKVIQPVDPIELIHESFRRNAKLRATVALAVCFYGFPSPHQDSLGLDVVSFASVDLASAKQASASLFDMLKFQKAVKILDPEVDLPEVDVLRTYVDEVLLPHCLRLCVNGNGPSTRHARGSHGDYETAFGISLHPEPSQPHPSPLPDPCLSLQYHSLEALGFAHAMLRRVRLLRTCTHLCSKYSEIHPDRTLAVAQSSEMGQLNCLPVWWSPCIHDIALLIQAATGGLFSILINRWSHPVFSPKALQDHLFMRLTHENSYIKENQYTVGSQAMSWTEHNAAAFPSLYQLERRLALLCSEATSGIQSENRFDYIPMFDHGGWPRN